jgi:hypothetical protein
MRRHQASAQAPALSTHSSICQYCHPSVVDRRFTLFAAQVELETEVIGVGPSGWERDNILTIYKRRTAILASTLQSQMDSLQAGPQGLAPGAYTRPLVSST